MKRKLNLPISLLLFFSLLISDNLFADHLIGGYTYYECLGTNGSSSNIKFSLEIIRESTGGGADFDPEIEAGIYRQENGIWEVYATVKSIINNRMPLLHQTNPYTYLPNNMVYHLGTYEFSINLPISQGPYMVVYQRCCRVQGEFKNVSSLDTTGTAFTTIITYAGLASCNNSPRVTPDGNRFLELNKYSEKDFNIRDGDQSPDAIEVRFSAPITAGGEVGSSKIPGDPTSCDGVIPNPSNCLPPFAPLSFSPGYSFAKPFGDSSDITFNLQTHILGGTPTEAGLYQIAFQVDDYRNGELLGSIQYEYVIEVLEYIEVAFIETNCYYDINQNQIRDPLEPDLNIPLSVKEPILQKSKLSNFRYQFAVDQTGNYTFFPTAKPQWRINSPDDSIRIDVNALSNTYQLEIPFIPTIDSLIFDVSITATAPLCNRTQEVTLTVYNFGMDDLSGSFCIYTDSLVQFPPSIPNVNPYKFNFSGIPPAENQSFAFELIMPDETHLGELLDYKVIYSISNADTSIADTLCWSSILQCAFDPNDKLAYPDRPAGTIFPGEGLQYMIRFQNTGNYVAKDVILRDTLDQNLDLSTLEVVSSSHFYHLKKKDNILQFNFLNIYLPDNSSNPDGSQGYINFRINPKAGLASNTLIKNRAAIYFDQNPPILTNTVKRILEERQAPPLSGISVYPNPYSDQLYVDLGTSAYKAMQIEFYDISGRYIGFQLLENDLNEIPVEAFNSGMYFYRVTTQSGEEVQSGKLVRH